LEIKELILNAGKLVRESQSETVITLPLYMLDNVYKFYEFKNKKYTSYGRLCYAPFIDEEANKIPTRIGKNNLEDDYWYTHDYVYEEKCASLCLMFEEDEWKPKIYIYNDDLAVYKLLSLNNSPCFNLEISKSLFKLGGIEKKVLLNFDQAPPNKVDIKVISKKYDLSKIFAPTPPKIQV